MIFTGTGNANKIGGIPVQTGTPSDTFTLLYDAASRRWIFGPSGTPPAGGVGGSANLTTVGFVPFVTAAGVLGQSPDLSLSRASAGVLQVGDGGANQLGQLSARAINAVSSLVAFNSTGGIYMSGNVGSSWGTIQSYSDAAGTAKATAINPTGGNLLIGTTTDGNFRLDVASSGSSGTLRAWDQAPTTGSTSLVVRAGAGQGTNNLTTWQNSGGTQVAAVTSAGDIYSLTLATTGNQAALTTNGIEVRSAAVAAWSSTTSWAGTKDLSLSRASANTLQVGDGGANSNGTILARLVQSAGVTVASLPAAAAGNAGTISYVTDSNSTTIGATVAGGGANRVLVWSNGTAWKIFAN